MLREIKFRAWDNATKDFWDPKPFKKIIYFDLKRLPSFINNTFSEDGKPFKKRFEIMQYTGLQDKRGKEIYEGDILTAGFYPFQREGKYNYHGVIEWIDELASFYMTKRLVNNNMRGISDGISEQIEDISYFEIIGNVYENPELLEQSHD